MLSEWVNLYRPTSNSAAVHSIMVSFENTPIGTYSTVDNPGYFEVTFYDGVVRQYFMPPVIAESVAQIPNQLSLQASNDKYYVYADDYFVSVPNRSRIYNEHGVTKERQWMEYAIDSNFEVREVYFPYHLTPITSIEYKTNLSATPRVATGGDLVFDYPQRSAGISKESVDLSNNEYIVWAKTLAGDFGPNYTSRGLSTYMDVTKPNRIIGRLKEGVNQASFEFKTYALLDGGAVEAGSENAFTSVIERENPPAVSLQTPSSAAQVVAGERKNVSFSLLQSQYYYSHHVGTVNPIGYLRLPPHVTIDSATVQATHTSGANVPVTVTGPYTAGGGE